MFCRFQRGAALVFVTCTIGVIAYAQAQSPEKPLALDVSRHVIKDDFDGMLARRYIRVVVPLSRTLYFNDHGRERGITADLVRDFETYLNRKYAKRLGKRPLTIVMWPEAREVILQQVAAGHADIAAGNLTVTDIRRKIVDFVAPRDQDRVNEIVLTKAGVPPLATADDLAGRRAYVRRSSSYYESLLALNERLKKIGKPTAELVIVPDALEDADMMEMLNAGILDAIVVDDWKAKLWSTILPKIVLNKTAILRHRGLTGWALRKNSPQLAAELNDFWVKFVKKQNLPAVRFKEAMRRVRQITNNTASAERKRYESTHKLFEKYGRKYGFDPLLLAAQGYQESRLRQNARSAVGAIGIMQIMPATGAAMKVGDIHVAEANIHAGAKYMHQLVTRYFRDAKFDQQNLSLFAIASYNAGPGRMAQMRKEAEKRGLDPNRWFDNVEIVTAEKVGMETTTYVRNIYKYYVAYKLMDEAHAVREKARKAVMPGR